MSKTYHRADGQQYAILLSNLVLIRDSWSIPRVTMTGRVDCNRVLISTSVHNALHLIDLLSANTD